MANYYVIMNQTEVPSRELQGENKKHVSGEVLGAQIECMYVKVSAGTEQEARDIIADKFASNLTQKPALILEANWKA